MLLTRGVWRQVPEIERQVLTTAIITVASQTGTRGANALFAYNAPRITSLFYSNGPTTGGTIITLFGEQFGLEEDELSSRLGPTTTNTTQWVADSIISVTTAEGVGVVDAFALDIIGIEIEFVNPSGDATDPAFAHNAPAVSYVTHNGPVGGGTRMSIQGANFGTAPVGWHMDGCLRYRNPDQPDPSQCVPGDSIYFGAGRTQGLAAEWTSDTSVLATLPRGVSAAQDLTVNVSKQVGRLSLAFSYDAPLTSALSLRNVPPQGGYLSMSAADAINAGAASVVAAGANLAQSDYSPAARWGATAAAYTAWVSTSALTLNAVRGLARSQTMAVSVASGGLPCPDVPADSETPLDKSLWESMTSEEQAAYLAGYQRGCDRVVFEQRVAVFFQQVTSLTAALSYDAPLAARARAAPPQDDAALPRAAGAGAGAFYGVFRPVASANQALRVRRQLLVTAELLPGWPEVRLRDCAQANQTLCALTPCNASANITGNCSYTVAMPAQWDNRTHASTFGPTPLTWGSHPSSTGVAVGQEEFRFNDMWNELTGAFFATADMTGAGKLGLSGTEASVWTSDSAMAVLASVTARGGSGHVALTVGTER